MFRKVIQNQFRQLTSFKRFSFLYHNLPSTNTYYYNNSCVVLDPDVESYDTTIQAFLQKRRTLKQEISSKIQTIQSPNLTQGDYSNDYIDLKRNVMKIMFDTN